MVHSGFLSFSRALESLHISIHSGTVSCSRPAKAGMVHSASGWTRGIQVKLRYLENAWDTWAPCISPRCEHTSEARVLKGSHSFTGTPRVHPLKYLSYPSQPKLVLVDKNGTGVWSRSNAWSRVKVKVTDTQSYDSFCGSVGLRTSDDYAAFTETGSVVHETS